MAVICAIDAGTTGVRAFAVDEGGQPAGWSYREFAQSLPAAGLGRARRRGDLGRRADDSRRAGGRPRATCRSRPSASPTSARPRWSGTAATGRPLAPAIVWQDRRTAARCDALQDEGQLPLIRRRTGLVLDPYFSATKLAWLLTEGGVDCRPGPRLRNGRQLDRLEADRRRAVHATDPTNASRTLLYDIRRLAWSAELCDLFGVPPSCLPEVRPSSGDFGAVSAGALPGVAAGTPDRRRRRRPAGRPLRPGVRPPGMTKNTFGTGSFVLMNVGPTCPDPVEGLLTTVGWTLADGTTAYALEGAIFVTGAAIQWLRDGLGVIAAAAEVGPLAESVPDTGGVVLVPAFTGLGSPWWDPHARGTIVGITRGTGRAQLARAVVEAMAYLTRDATEAMTRGLRAPDHRAPCRRRRRRSWTC